MVAVLEVARLQIIQEGPVVEVVATMVQVATVVMVAGRHLSVPF